MTATTNDTKLTTIISAVSFWHPGHGALATLSNEPDDVGFNRQKVSGTYAGFLAAIDAVHEMRAELRGADKASASAVIKNLASAVAGYEHTTGMISGREAMKARFAELRAAR